MIFIEVERFKMNIIQIAASRLDVTITELADLLNIPYRTLYKWETGERVPPAAAVTAVKLLIFIESHNLMNEWLNERNNIMQNKLVRVAEAIMDSAAEEYRTQNLTDINSVKAYAENGMDIYLTDDEAKKILLVCLAMKERLENGEIPDKNDWHNSFTTPLSK